MYRYVQRRNQPRTVPMQVLGLGFSRTGTSCMFLVLVASSSEIWCPQRCALPSRSLGTGTNHGFTIWTSPPEMEMWTEAINVKFFGMGKPYGRAEWDQLLGHCMKSSWPRTPRPGKIVLNTRNVDSWWKSYKVTIGGALTNPFRDLIARLEVDTAGKVREFWHLVFFAMFRTKHVTEQIAKARYIEYYKEVWRLVQKEQLLEYRVGEGWESLCEFLDKGIPAEPFPKVNDTRRFTPTCSSGCSPSGQSRAQVSVVFILYGT
ncbi:hypothetical protein B0H13DRAFT_1883047 [Mycena leptocephala]|nr:hypothetical protein B0H13DRAFT_1883047 [Mycena leptocephala]